MCDDLRQKRSTGKTTECSKHLRHIAIEKDVLSELQIYLKYIKLVIPKILSKITWHPTKLPPPPKKKIYNNNNNNNNNKSPIQFRRESQPHHLKRLSFLKNRPISFHINSTSVIRPVKWNQLSFSSIKINKPQCLVDQIQVQKSILVVATDQMPNQT